MRIGIDLDNTIIYYDEAFCQSAVTRKLLPEGFHGTKQQVRDAIRLLPDGETEWQRLQGFVYGQGLGLATPFEGVLSFLETCTQHGHSVAIVSHKTEWGHFDPLRINLRHAALNWLEKQGFFESLKYGLSRDQIYFESTRSEKVATIQRLGFDWFIDDLIEVFEEPDFPVTTRKILFHTSPLPVHSEEWFTCHDWREIASHVLGRA